MLQSMGSQGVVHDIVTEQHKRLGQTYLSVLEGFLQRQGAAVAGCRDKGLAVAVLEHIHWHKPS